MTADKLAIETKIDNRRIFVVILAGLLATFLFLLILPPILTTALSVPVIEDQAFSVLENSATGTFVGKVVATDTITYTIIAGNSSGAFALNATSGDLTVADGTQLDSETTPIFTLTVEAKDNNGQTDTGLMTINVININDAPVVDDQTFTVEENSANSTSVGTVVASDSDGNLLTYVILAGNAGSTFALNLISGELTVADNTLLDYETRPLFSLVVKVSDGGLVDIGIITVDLTDANDLPVAINDEGYSTAENTPLVGATPSTLANDTDQDAATILTAVLDAQPANGTVSLNSNGTFTYTPDLNFNGIDTYTYFANDGQANSALAATVTITVTGVNDSPTANDDPDYTTPEDTPLTVSAPGILGNDTDPENDSLNAVLAGGPVTGTLNLSSDGSFVYTPTLNFAGAVTFTYYAEDGEPKSSNAATVTIRVTGENDRPTINDDQFRIDENSAITTFVGSVTASDPDAGDVLAFSIIGGNTGTTFAIDGGTGDLTVNDNSLLDFETNPTFTLTVQVEDLGILTDDATIVISLNNINEAPTAAADPDYTTPEDTPLTISASGVLANDTDPEQDVLTAVFEGGPSSGTLDFAVDGSFTFTPTLNFIGPVTFTYHAIDGEPLSSNSATVTIDVTAENDPPNINDDAFSIDENSANTTFVGNIPASDPDAGDSHTFSITGGNGNNAFAIGTSSGDISVNNRAALDFETTPIFTVTVQVKDTAGLTDIATIIITLNNLNEAPTANNGTANVPENSPTATSVIGVTATDQDLGDVLAYGITLGNTGNTFAINPGTGNITVNNNTLLDFETNPQFVLTVVVTDTSDFTDTAQITINVDNVNEFPPDINTQTFSVIENSANGTLVGTIVVTDSDGIDTTAFTITAGDPNGIFAIDNVGDMTVVDNSSLDFETTPVITATVIVTDSGGLADTALMIINVQDANDAPIISSSDLTVTPGTIQETEMITVSGVFTDQDAADAHTITINWDDGTPNTIINLAVAVDVFSATHTYDDDPVGMPDDYQIGVTVEDAASSGMADKIVTVNNVAPILGNLAPVPLTLTEGQMITLTGSITEVNPLDSFLLKIDWGDGVIDNLSYPAGTTTFLEVHTYLDNYQPATIKVTLTDDDDGSDVGATAATITNVAPTADAGPPRTVQNGDPISFMGYVTDPGAWDSHTFDWDFGDGNGIGGTATPTHIYGGVGVYTVTLTVTDDDGDSASDTTTITVVSPSDLIGLKSVTGDFNEGGTVVYTIVLFNSGTTTQLDNPGDEFEDVLPAELSLVAALVTDGGGSATAVTATNTVTWSGQIPARTRVVIEIEAVILPGFRGQTVSNQGQIHYDADGNGTNDAITFTDEPTQPGNFDPTVFTVREPFFVYLPVMGNSFVQAPDLIVTNISASSDLIEVTIKNQGSMATNGGFWVDFYIDPSIAPTGPNQLWSDTSNEGLAWGTTISLAAQESLTLSYSTDAAAANEFYVPEESLYNGLLPVGTPVYAQVDSAHVNVLYGGILETHEITGGAYNNIASTVATGVSP